MIVVAPVLFLFYHSFRSEEDGYCTNKEGKGPNDPHSYKPFIDQSAFTTWRASEEQIAALKARFEDSEETRRAANHERLRFVDLVLEPRAASLADLVAGVPPLGDYALKPKLLY